MSAVISESVRCCTLLDRNRTNIRHIESGRESSGNERGRSKNHGAKIKILLQSRVTCRKDGRDISFFSFPVAQLLVDLRAFAISKEDSVQWREEGRKRGERKREREFTSIHDGKSIRYFIRFVVNGLERCEQPPSRRGCTHRLSILCTPSTPSSKIL